MYKQYPGLLLFLLLCCLSPVLVKAQADSVAPALRRPELSNSAFCLRFSNGIQRNYFIELGVSRTSFVGSGHGIYGFEYFATASYLPSFKKDGDQIFGAKAGATLFGNLFLLGVDVAYYGKSPNFDVLITPKAGIGISNLYISYGYAISAQKYTIAEIGKHQVALTANLPIYNRNRIKQKGKWVWQ